MTSFTCCISIVVSPPCESSSFPAYCGSVLVKLCRPVFYLWSSFASHTHDICYFQNSDSQLSYMYTAYTSLACVAVAIILHFQTLATCQATTTRLAAGHPSSVLSQAFHQSNFAILAISPHTLTGCVL